MLRHHARLLFSSGLFSSGLGASLPLSPGSSPGYSVAGRALGFAPDRVLALGCGAFRPMRATIPRAKRPAMPGAARAMSKRKRGAAPLLKRRGVCDPGAVKGWTQALGCAFAPVTAKPPLIAAGLVGFRQAETV
jgi:hypothetical protein